MQVGQLIDAIHDEKINGDIVEGWGISKIKNINGDNIICECPGTNLQKT